METIRSFFFLRSANFGDGINDFFFDALSLKTFEYIPSKCGIPNPIERKHFLATGSILSLCNKNSVILGSGFIADYDTVREEPCQIISVRGPKTRNKLLEMGIECPENYGDPLLLFPLVYKPTMTIDNTNDNTNVIGILPHYIDEKTDNLNLLKKKLSGHKIIDIKITMNRDNDYKKIISDINKCDTIISSSLHGVILSVIYKKKTIYTTFSENVIGNGFKFEDFFGSMQIYYKMLQWDDPELLNNYIYYKNTDMTNVGINMINTYPFLDDLRKDELMNLWIDYCK